MITKILGPSPLLYSLKKIKTIIDIRGGNQSNNEICLSDEAFFEMLVQDAQKPRRMTQTELEKLYKSNAKLTKDKQLLKSILDECSATHAISEQSFKNVQELYEFRTKYKRYLRLKRFLPLGIITPLTSIELSKMAYAAALGSKSVALTLPGIVGYSMPAFFFFHMSSYYAPDKIKPICNICKYTLGGAFWVVNCLVDELASPIEEKIFGESVAIDVTQTGGSISADIGDFNKLREVLDDVKEWSQDFGTKTY